MDIIGWFGTLGGGGSHVFPENSFNFLFQIRNKVSTVVNPIQISIKEVQEQVHYYQLYRV